MDSTQNFLGYVPVSYIPHRMLLDSLVIFTVEKVVVVFTTGSMSRQSLNFLSDSVLFHTRVSVFQVKTVLAV